MRKEEASTVTREDEQLELPPGFRFHPTDEELITHYLSPKVSDHSFSPLAIGEVDLNKVEPWDLPWRARMGEKEWYFFCVKDRKYPTGLRTNRATEAGYWKATGKDKEIFKSKALVGMKKTLVFYKGRAPKGEKTNWVMHEYRLDGKNLIHTITKPSKSEWVISRIFKKSSGGKKVHISGLIKATKYNYENSEASNLPPLMEYSAAEPSYVTCFSNSMEDQKSHHLINNDHSNFSYLAASSAKPHVFSHVSPSSPKISIPNLFFPAQMVPYMENLQYTDSVLMQDQSILRLLLDGQYAKVNGLSQDTGSSTDMSSSISHHGADLRSLDVLWNY